MTMFVTFGSLKAFIGSSRYGVRDVRHGFVLPTLDDARKFSRLRIAPMIRDSKPLRAKVSDIKAKDSPVERCLDVAPPFNRRR